MVSLGEEHLGGEKMDMRISVSRSTWVITMDRILGMVYGVYRNLEAAGDILDQTGIHGFTIFSTLFPSSPIALLATLLLFLGMYAHTFVNFVW